MMDQDYSTVHILNIHVDLTVKAEMKWFLFFQSNVPFSLRLTTNAFSSRCPNSVLKCWTIRNGTEWSNCFVTAHKWIPSPDQH